MYLRVLARNMTEVGTDNARVLFSYNTPVAAYIYEEGFVRTEERHGRTTTRHINAWLDGREAQVVPQSRLNSL